MKTSIDHLPEDKQRKLREITAIFTEPRDGSPIGMLILFGSHARGDWVEDAETGYKSDYDFLVVVETEAQVADVMLWGEIEQRVRAVIADTPLTLIVHDVKFVNRGIRIGALLTKSWVTNQAQCWNEKECAAGAPYVVLVSKQGSTGAHDAQCKHVIWRAQC